MQVALSVFFIMTFLVIASGAGTRTRAVKPCPTNKIAPHRRIVSSENRLQHRTFGIFDPNRMQYQNPPLREPQTDDLDDCGDIEDYDENDLSSLISTVKRQESPGRLFFNAFQNQLQQQRPLPNNYQPPTQYHPLQNNYQQQFNSQGPQGPRPQPPRPYPPPRPTKYPAPRPQFASGDNHRRPPEQQFSNNVKPVYEGNPYFDERPTTYRPHTVGGPINHVVGHATRTPQVPTTTPRPDYKIQVNTQPYFNSFSRPENPRTNNYSQSILGSFIDLLFK